MQKEKIKDYLKSLKSYSFLIRSDRYTDIVAYVNETTSFLPETPTAWSLRVKCVVNDIIEMPKCPVCDQDRSILSTGLDFSNTCGDKACINHMRKTTGIQTNLKKWGHEYPNQADEVKEKKKNTSMQRYGVEHYTQTEEYRLSAKGISPPDDVREKRADSLRKVFYERGKEIQQKRVETNIKRYGVEYTSQLPSNREKAKQTHIANHGTHYLTSEKAKRDRIAAFGCENYFATDEFKRRIKEHNQAKSGTNHHLQSNEMYQKLIDKDWLLAQYQDRTIVDIADEINTTPSTVWNYLELYGVEVSIHAADKVSFGEREICQYLDSLEVEYLTSVRDVISPLELDIYVPDRKIAIEFNGIYWHTDRFRDKKYHQNKALRCMERGIQLIHVWEDDWHRNRDVVKKKIAAKFGQVDRVYARKTGVVIPSISEVRKLYEENHLQGFVRASVHIGLEYDGKLVACASFHNMKDGVWDLNRFASSVQVVGGFSKILSYFEKSYEWKTIITYAHLDYSHGGMYNTTGFVMDKITSPGMWYVKGSVRYQRERFMKHRLAGVLDHFDPSLTERENMLNGGYRQLHDAGSIKFIKENGSSV